MGEVDFGKTPNHEAIVPGKDINGVWLEPVPSLIVDELKIWAKLKNKYILELLGVCEQQTPNGSIFHFVSPYMDHGNAVEYLKREPTAQRSLLVRDILVLDVL